MALENFVVTFHGVKSHAAISPEEGRSALDAAHNAIVYAAKIMADSICNVLVNPELLAQIKQEFEEAREKG